MRAPSAEHALASALRPGPTRGGAVPTSEATAPARPRPRGPVRPFLREISIVLVSAVVLSWVVKTFLVQAFFIPSASMRDTLLEGDRVLVNKLAPGPFDLHRGDIVVFADPGGW
ncbi:MAG: signal peptidase I, partial [Micrococcales bacterium]|nr:signal peptidase I [Micrococcales bacterium]